MASTRPEEPHRQPPVWLDAHQIKVLAHPLRARLLGELRINGPATATTLARTLSTNTGATSYHLRQLADAGMVVDEPGGTGRQRLWKAAHQSHGWWGSDFAGDPDTEAALSWLAGAQMRLMSERAEAWQRVRWSSPREWQDAARTSDYVVHLSAARLNALNSELAAVVRRYQAEPDTGSAGRKVLLLLAAIPHVEEGS